MVALETARSKKKAGASGVKQGERTTAEDVPEKKEKKARNEHEAATLETSREAVSLKIEVKEGGGGKKGSKKKKQHEDVLSASSQEAIVIRDEDPGTEADQGSGSNHKVKKKKKTGRGEEEEDGTRGEERKGTSKENVKVLQLCSDEEAEKRRMGAQTENGREVKTEEGRGGGVEEGMKKKKRKQKGEDVVKQEVEATEIQEVTSSCKKKKKKKKREESSSSPADTGLETAMEQTVEEKKKKKKKKKREESSNGPADTGLETAMEQTVEEKKKKREESSNGHADTGLETAMEQTVEEKKKKREESSSSPADTSLETAMEQKVEEEKKKKRKRDESSHVEEEGDEEGDEEVLINNAEPANKNETVAKPKEGKSEGADGEETKEKKKRKKRKVETEEKEDKVACEESCTPVKKTKKKKGDTPVTMKMEREDSDDMEAGKLARQREADQESHPKAQAAAALGQWSSAQFDSTNQRDKFLRLMGGFKKSSQPMAASGGRANMALGKEGQQSLQQGLLGEFERAQSRRVDFGARGAGLGFSAPSNKKFSIDADVRRSVRFDD